jgi:hypothetical protein
LIAAKSTICDFVNHGARNREARAIRSVFPKANWNGTQDFG